MLSILKQHELDDQGKWLDRLDVVTADDVVRELDKPAGRFTLERMAALVSPTAESFLEEMAQQARELTMQRFGRTIQLYAPLYVSSYCINSCRYCGFNRTHDYNRTRLTIDEALAEADIISSEGFRHILLVSGEDPQGTPPEYFCELARKLRRKFSSISIEIYPMSTADYAKLFAAGIDGVTLYQETYDRKTYAHYHQAGPKCDYDYRVNSPDRFSSAGMRRIGLGVLLGLNNFRTEALALALHGAYLMKVYWKSQVSFSFPRIRSAFEVDDRFEHLVSDRNMVQMMLALRLCFADAGIVLSTRESRRFRENTARLCVTRISAGSKTNPGGYTGQATTEQFSIDDDRPAHQIADMIASAGLEPVWKDWDKAFSS